MNRRPMEFSPPRQLHESTVADLTGGDEVGLRVDGELGRGGTAEFLLNGLIIGRLVLPPIEWAVLAMLVRAAHSLDAEWADVFLTTDEMVRKLEALELTDSTNPKVVTKAVFRLRKRLSETRQLQKLPVEEGSQEPLGWRLIETRRYLGYRIVLRPEQLQLRERNEQGT